MDWGYRLDPFGDDEVFVLAGASRYHCAVGELLDPDEARARHAGAPFLEWRSPCPFLGDLAVVGYFEWRLLDDDPQTQRDLLIPLIKEGKGLIAPLRDDAPPRPAVVEQALPVSDTLSKWGFDDGAIFLTRGDDLRDYRGETCSAIRRALEAHGIEAGVGGPETTCHNMCQLYSPVLINGKTLTVEEDYLAIDEALARIEVKLWVYDFSILEDERLLAGGSEPG